MIKGLNSASFPGHSRGCLSFLSRNGWAVPSGDCTCRDKWHSATEKTKWLTLESRLKLRGNWLWRSEIGNWRRLSTGGQWIYKRTFNGLMDPETSAVSQTYIPPESSQTSVSNLKISLRPTSSKSPFDGGKLVDKQLLLIPRGNNWKLLTQFDFHRGINVLAGPSDRERERMILPGIARKEASFFASRKTRV